MNTIELIIHSRRDFYRCYQFTGPSTWAEVSPKEAVSLMRFRRLVNESLPVVFPILTMLYGVKQEEQKWLFDERFLRRKGIEEDQRERALVAGQKLIDTIRWIGSTEPGPSFLAPYFRLFDFQYGSAHVLFSRLFARTLYYAPAEGLGSSSFEEFMFAEKAYQDGDFTRLVAILYRPSGDTPGSDGRESFDRESIETRIDAFSVLEPALVDLCVFQYEACLRYLQRCFPHVFPKRTITEGERPDKTSKKGASWLEIAIGMAKLDVTKISQIEQINLYLALKVLDEQVRQAEETEDYLTSIRTK